MENQLLNSKIIMDLDEKLQQGNNEALDEFWRHIEEKGAPITEKIDGNFENDLATFIYKSEEETENVLLISPIGLPDLQECKMERVLETNLWYKTYELKNDLRMAYSFVVNDNFDDDWQGRCERMEKDKFHEKGIVYKSGNGDPDVFNSVIQMPNAEEHYWVNEKEDTAKGILKEFKFASKQLDEDRKIRIYTPAGYGEEKEPCGLLVLTDGDAYVNMLSAPMLLDNLIGCGKIPPMVALFIDSTENRSNELRCNDTFGAAVANEMIPWVRENYNVSEEASKNIIAGLSLGGLTASYLGLKYSDVFGNVLSQSGSYWYAPEGYEGACWMGEQFGAAEKLPLNFYLNVGVLENKERMIGTNHKLRDLLLEKGYTVAFEQFNSGHDYLCWGETLANGLIHLMEDAHNLPIETERLIIRKWEKEDFEQYNFLCQESIRGDFFEGWAMEESAAKNFFGWQLSKYENMDPVEDVIGLAIIEKSTGQVIGHGGIGKHDDVDETEVFYGLIKSSRKNGYGTEVSKAITKWALDSFEIPYIIGTVEVENIGSQKVLERSGYSYVEDQVHNVSVLGKSLDFKYYRCYRENE